MTARRRDVNCDGCGTQICTALSGASICVAMHARQLATPCPPLALMSYVARWPRRRDKAPEGRVSVEFAPLLMAFASCSVCHATIGHHCVHCTCACMATRSMAKVQLGQRPTEGQRSNF
jgi:hypothetical protein